MKYRNVPDLFFRRANKYGDRALVRYCTRPGAELQDLSWNDIKAQVEETAMGLKKLGVKNQEHVGLLAITSREWMPTDLAIQSIAAVTVPLYHNSSSDSVAQIVEHAEIKVVFVGDKIQLQKVRANWDKLPDVQYAIVLRDRGDIPTNDPKILTLDQLRKIGRTALETNPTEITDGIKDIPIENLASIIYTSGTTGIPKGVMLSHKNFLVAALSFYQYVPLEDDYNMLSFLPLAHIFERVSSMIYGIDQGVTFTYAEKVEHLPQLLIDSDADVMCVVPRILEKIHAKVMLRASKMEGMTKKIFENALAIGIEYARKKLNNESISWDLQTKYSVARRTILKKIKDKIAPNMKTFIVGGAPFSVEISYFFHAIGLEVVEGYGLTETSAPISVNPMGSNRPGTVGLPFRHFEVKISDEGEIICRGDAVFSGYFKNPEATSAVIDEEGWFHTGDLGEFDEEGYIKITGRKKDLIITAGGKNVAPTHVENTLLQSKYLSQVVVLGDREKYLACLVAIDRNEVKLYLRDKGIHYDPKENFGEIKEVYELIDLEIKKLNPELSRYEQIKAFHILEKELSIDAGELTPTLKVKRNVVREKYKDIIQPLFNRTKAKN